MWTSASHLENTSRWLAYPAQESLLGQSAARVDKPQRGSVTVDGAPLDAEQLAQLRRHTAWIAPEVHLFQASLLDNLNYGNGSDSTGRVGLAIQSTDLLSVLERLPDGLQTELGESGALALAAKDKMSDRAGDGAA